MSKVNHYNLPPALVDAEWDLNSAIIRGAPQEEKERLRKVRDIELMRSAGIPQDEIDKVYGS